MKTRIYENNDVLLTLYEENEAYYLCLHEVLQYCKTDRSTFVDPIQCYLNDRTLIQYQVENNVTELIRVDVALIRLCRSRKTSFALLVHWILLTFKFVLNEEGGHSAV